METKNEAKSNEAPKPSSKGTTYDLSIPTEGADGKTTWNRVGTLFVRENGSGGVVYLTEAFLKSSPKVEDGEVKIPVFKKKPRPAAKPAA